MNCALIHRYAGAYTDGELDPATQLDFDKHLACCAGCQEYVAFARSMSEQVPGALGVVASSTLKDRIVASLDNEAGSQRRGAQVPLIQIHPWNWKQGWPVVVAAVALLIVGSVVRLRGQEQVQTAGMLEDMVTLHSVPLPSDVSAQQSEETPQRVAQYFQGKVRFPVRPAVFDHRDARLVGARLSNVRDRQAAALYYDLGGRRVTVVVFEGQELQRSGQRMRVGDREVMYYLVGGHTVPVRQQDGLQYAFIGDFDRETLMRLAASARVPF